MTLFPKQGNQGLLGRWYAQPLTAETAARLVEAAERQWHARLRRGTPCRLCPLLVFIGRYWLDHSAEEHYRQLTAGAKTRRQQALIELVTGQLLMARRLARAHGHLEAGFELASGLFAPGDYFEVFNRHALLRRLPLSRSPSPAADLPDLLTAARVIERLDPATSRPSDRAPS